MAKVRRVQQPLPRPSASSSRQNLYSALDLQEDSICAWPVKYTYMASYTQSSGAIGPGNDLENAPETFNAFAVPADHEDQFLNAQYDASFSGWNGHGFPSLYDAFNEQEMSSGLSSGFATPDLVTRSNMPNSDTSRRIPSPGTGHSIAHNDKPVYRSRLPRREVCTPAKVLPYDSHYRHMF